MIVGYCTLAFPMFNFEKLEVWQKAIALADVIYSHTRNFPAAERFGLTNQMRRSMAAGPRAELSGEISTEGELFTKAARRGQS